MLCLDPNQDRLPRLIDLGHPADAIPIIPFQDSHYPEWDFQRLILEIDRAIQHEHGRLVRDFDQRLIVNLRQRTQIILERVGDYGFTADVDIYCGFS